MIRSRKTLTNQRIKFILDSKLRIEHSVPFAKDFQLTLSGGGELIRHRVAFFSEDIGLDLIAFLQDRGVQIIRYRGNNLYNRRSQTTNVRFFFFKLFSVCVRKKIALRPLSGLEFQNFSTNLTIFFLDSGKGFIMQM